MNKPIDLIVTRYRADGSMERFSRISGVTSLRGLGCNHGILRIGTGLPRFADAMTTDLRIPAGGTLVLEAA